MIDAVEQVSCKACGRPIAQKSGKGHRKREYCDDRCKQRYWRKQEQQTAEARIAALEIEVQRLQERLNVEARFRTDTQVRHFKAWIRSHPQAQDTDFFKRFLADTRLPQHASRALYEARLRLYQYSLEDIYLFQEAWKELLSIQT
jgi:hypothetical protein